MNYWFIDLIKDEGETFVREGLQRMGYHSSSLKPFRTKRFNIMINSKLVDGQKSKPLEVVVREAVLTEIDTDLIKILTTKYG